VRITYDESVNAAYAYLADEIPPGGVKHVYPCDPLAVNGMINLDFDIEGRLVGIEVLGASVLLAAEAIQGIDSRSSMQALYDPLTDMAHIYFSGASFMERVRRTYSCDPASVNGRINLGFDLDGRFVRIEILEARRLLPPEVIEASEALGAEPVVATNHERDPRASALSIKIDVTRKESDIQFLSEEEAWARVSREAHESFVEVFPKPSGGPWVFALEGAIGLFYCSRQESIEFSDCVLDEKSNMQIQIASLPGRKRAVAELLWKGEIWGEVNQEFSELILEIYSREDGTAWVFPLDEILNALASARARLLAPPGASSTRD
jgi:uncharacterized protein YuzE